MSVQPQLKFWHNNTELYMRLRGGQAFDYWAELGFDVEQTDLVTNDIQVPTWILLSCPADMRIANFVGRTAGCPDCCIAVDVPFPFTALNHTIGEKDKFGTDLGRAFWTDPDHRAAGLRAIETADIVTVPVAYWPGYPQFLDDMKVLNPNTIVLPDLVDDDIVPQYMRTLMGAWAKAVRTKVKKTIK